MKLTEEESILKTEGHTGGTSVRESIARTQDLVTRAKTEIWMACDEDDNWIEGAQIEIGVSAELFEVDLTEVQREAFLNTSLGERFRTLLIAWRLPSATQSQIDSLDGASERALAIAYVANQMEFLRHLERLEETSTFERRTELEAMAYQIESILLETMPRSVASSTH